MTLLELGTVLVGAMSALPRPVNVDETMLKVWHNLFRNHSAEAFASAVNLVLMESDFPPTPAAVNRALHRLSSPVAELTDGEAWAILRKAIERFGYPNPKQAIQWIRAQNEYVAEAAECLGWGQICAWKDDDAVGNRAQFWRVFNGLQKRDLEHKHLGLPKPARLALGCHRGGGI